jgi:FixJ family two-component response regulator
MNLYQRISPSFAPKLWRPIPTVFVVDDDISVRESLELLIRISGWRAETFASAQEFLSRPREPSPSCLVCDVTLPDLNGLDLQQLVADRLEMPIIFISGYGNVPMTVRAMKAGAIEFLTKPFGDDELRNAIFQAIERSDTALREAGRVRILQDRYETLSPREREVMALVVAGKMNKQIAADLHISQITVKAHRRKVMEKTKADSLADLVRIASALHIAPAEHGRRVPWGRDVEFPAPGR